MYYKSSLKYQYYYFRVYSTSSITILLPRIQLNLMQFSFISILIPFRNHHVLNTKQTHTQVGGEIVIPNYRLITTIGDHSHFASLPRKKKQAFLFVALRVKLFSCLLIVLKGNNSYIIKFSSVLYQVQDKARHIQTKLNKLL